MPLEVRMIELYRLAGSILIKSKNQFYLLGNFKEPCNLNEYGFEQVDFDALQTPYLKLNIYDESKTIFFAILSLFYPIPNYEISKPS